MATGVRQMDLAIGDVHAPTDVVATPARRKKIPMADLPTETRNGLPASSFADPEERKYPIENKAHADNAAARLEQQKSSMPPAKYREIKRRIQAAQRKFGEAPKKAMANKKPTVGIRAQLGPGGHLHVRHLASDSRSVEEMSDGTFCMRDTRRITSGTEVSPADVGVKLVGPSTWKDGSAKSLVWVQVAETGAWKGHGSGPFEMTSQTFSEIVTNFDARGLPVQWDMEHSSEMPATDGTIPITGVPAQGWIHRLDNRGPAGLWGLTEWLEYARDGIRDGKFAWCSPAVRFGCKDGVTGKPIGARLTSCAITGSPFLTGLSGLVAAKDHAPVAETAMTYFQIKGGAKPLLASLAEQAVLMAGKGGAALAHKPHEYMPAVKSALGLHDLSMPQQCCDQLESLRDQVEACGDAEGMHHGVDLGAYTRPLRTLVDAQPGESWDDVFDAVDGLIQAAMADHEAKFNAGQTPAQPNAELTLDDPGDGADMSDQAAAVALSDAQTKAKTLETEKATLLTEKGALATQLKDATDKVTAAETRAVAAETALKAVALKDGETPAAAIARIVEENAALLADKVNREAADLSADVDIAFSTYKDVKKLSDGDKVHMLAIAKANRQAFNGMYPPIAPDQRHLLRSTPAEPRPTGHEGEEHSYSALTKKLMADKGMTYSEACVEAAKIVKSRG